MRGRDPLIIHYVADMDSAIEFYRHVFQVDTLFVSPGWTTLDFGNFELALHILYESDTHGSQDNEAPIPHAGLNMLVDNIEEMQSHIETMGGQLITLREPDGFVPVRVAAFRDCAGNGFELRQEP